MSGTSAKLLGKLKIPAEKVSSVTFGGPNLDKLYVTTISLGVTPEKFNEYPMTGKVLEVSGLGVKGTKNNRVREKCFTKCDTFYERLVQKTIRNCNVGNIINV